MKFVTLMNPSRRRSRRSRRRVARSRAGRFVSRRRVRRNPSPRRRRARIVYRTRTRVIRRRVHSNPGHHSPAMRRKIGLAVKRAMAARRRGGAVSRRSARRSVTVIRRSSRRRFGGGGSSFGGGSLISSFKSALSKGMLMKAGGAVGGTLLVSYALRRFGDKMPLANHPYGRCIYTLGIPVAAAYFVRRKNRDLAEGLVIGGLVMTINTLIAGFRPGGAALPAAAPAAAPLGSYSVAGELGTGQPFSYYPQGMDDPHAMGGGNAAFPSSAW